MAATPYVLLVLQTLSAFLFAWVGLKVGRRRVSPEAMTAVRLFCLWWYGLAALSLAAPILAAAAVLAPPSVAFTVALVDVLLGFICAALMGLVYYLLYVYTGRRAWLAPVAVFYAILFGALLYLVADADPVGFAGEGVGRHLVYARDPAGTPLATVLGLALLLPPLAAAVAYGALFLRVTDATARYRIAMVSGGFVAWFGSSLLSNLLHVAADSPWRILTVIVSACAALVILAAYYPPRWARRRLHVESVTAEAA